MFQKIIQFFVMSVVFFLFSANLVFTEDANYWHNTGNADNYVRAIRVEPSTNILYVGGDFGSIGGQTIQGLARWTNGNWNQIDGGINGKVYAITFAPNGDMVVGGWFNVAGGQLGFGNIARWDGNSWQKFGTGLNGLVRAVAVDANGNVYAGGNFIFTTAGLRVNYVAKWNGSSWEALAGIYQGNPQTGVNQPVYALGIQYGSDVYIGGTFTMVEGSGGSNPRGDGLMVWRPSYGWDDYVTGPGTPVYAIEVKDGEVYLGGNFYRSIVSTYNGSQFYEFGNGVDGAVRAITFEDQGYGFYIGGDFTTGSGLTLNRVAKWDGLSWDNLCNGVNGTVYGVGYLPVPQGAQGYPGIYVGGKFTSASGVPAQYLARWDTGSDQQGPPGSNQKKSKVAVKISSLIPNSYKLSQNYPNPFNPATHIQYALSKDGWATLKVYDVSGKLVSVLVDEFQHAGEYRVKFNAVRFPAGVYFYRLTSGSFSDTKKMLLVK